MVLKANGHGRLATVALRPSNIYGEHDPLFIPLAVQKAREGKMKYRIGNGTMMPTYAGNAAHAHIQVSFSQHTSTQLAFMASADGNLACLHVNVAFNQCRCAELH